MKLKIRDRVKLKHSGKNGLIGVIVRDYQRIGGEVAVDVEWEVNGKFTGRYLKRNLASVTCPNSLMKEILLKI